MSGPLPEVPPQKKTRTVAVLLGSAGGVSGAGSGARPSNDAKALVKWALSRGVLSPLHDRLVAVHCVELSPLVTSTARVVTDPVVGGVIHPQWMPPALASAFSRFTKKQGGKGASALRLETALPAQEALTKFLSGDLFGKVTGTFDASPPNDWNLTGAPPKDAVDLVLVGTRDGEGFVSAGDFIKRAVLGSVSKFVLKKNPVPVLVVRQKDARRASGFGNDKEFTQPGSIFDSIASSVSDNESMQLGGGASVGPNLKHATSFPGNWRVDENVDTDADDDSFDDVYGDVLRGNALPTDHAYGTEGVNTKSLRDDVFGNALQDDACGTEGGKNSLPDLSNLSLRPTDTSAELTHTHTVHTTTKAVVTYRKIFGNVVCVAHDGGEDGCALVRWALRFVVRPDDRAIVVVHVCGRSPDSLTLEFEGDSTSVSKALQQSDDDVTHAFAQFRKLTPAPTTTPASSVIVVGDDDVTKSDSSSKLGPYLPPGSNDTIQNKWGLGALLKTSSDRGADLLILGSRGHAGKSVLRKDTPFAPALTSSESASSIASNVSSLASTGAGAGPPVKTHRRGAGGAAKTCARLAPCAVLAVPSHALQAFRKEK